MGTLAGTLLAIAGLDGQKPAARPQRRRPAEPPRRVPVRTGGGQVASRPSARPAQARPNPGYVGGFEDISAKPESPVRRPDRTDLPPPRRKSARRFGALGMLLLAGLFLACGGWVGGQVQAITLGNVRHEAPVDPNQSRPLDGPAFTF